MKLYKYLSSNKICTIRLSDRPGQLPCMTYFNFTKLRYVCGILKRNLVYILMRIVDVLAISCHRFKESIKKIYKKNKDSTTFLKVFRRSAKKMDDLLSKIFPSFRRNFKIVIKSFLNKIRTIFRNIVLQKVIKQLNSKLKTFFFFISFLLFTLL